MQPHPSRPVPQTLVSNPYSWAGYRDQTTTYDDASMEQQVSSHEEGSDVGDSQDIPQPDSMDIPLPNSQDIPQPDDPAQRVLMVNEVYTIGVFVRIYLCMFFKF